MTIYNVYYTFRKTQSYTTQFYAIQLYNYIIVYPFQGKYIIVSDFPEEKHESLFPQSSLLL